jgi:V8-like Glu-specific endopeptidase
MRLAASFSVAAVVAVSAASAGHAQVSELMRFDSSPHVARSGVHVGAPGDAAPEPELRYYTVVTDPGANMMRVHFGAFDLGRVSEIRLSSIEDGRTQRFTDESLVAWDGWSAIFNGDAVLVELIVAADETVSFEIDQIASNRPKVELAEVGGVATICGSDNRAASSDSRVGRLSGPNCGSGGGCGGCTAWLTALGCALTAGHCGTASGGLIEFNVPASDSDGTPNAADPDDQYPVGVSFYAFQEADEGFDWAIMDVGPNSNTGLRAQAVQGSFHLTPLLPADDVTVRVTGYGLDDAPSGSAPSQCCGWDDNGNCTKNGCNADSLTLQTSSGPKVDHTTNTVSYAVDTEPANSGSPVMFNSTNFAFAIHTNGGCTSSGGSNLGTRLTQATLEEYLNVFLGTNGRFVDAAAPNSLPIGTALYPMWTVTSGIAVTPSGGILSVAGGTYSAASGNTGTFSTPMTIIAPSGTVTIGN